MSSPHPLFQKHWHTLNSEGSQQISINLDTSTSYKTSDTQFAFTSVTFRIMTRLPLSASVLRVPLKLHELLIRGFLLEKRPLI